MSGSALPVFLFRERLPGLDSHQQREQRVKTRPQPKPRVGRTSSPRTIRGGDQAHARFSEFRSGTRLEQGLSFLAQYDFANTTLFTYPLGRPVCTQALLPAGTPSSGMQRTVALVAS